jgi:ACS family hexuronate transporter-like MFS transporter
MLERRIAWLVAITATLTMTVSYIDRATLAALAPSVTKALDISETGYGWLTAMFSVAYLISTPLAGRWIDQIGARRGLVGSVVVWSSIGALHAVAPGFGVLLALRFALGIAEGPGFPGAAQTMQRVLPPADRPRGFGMLFMGSSIGIMLVPPLASLIYREAGWRVAFLVTAGAGALWVPLWIAVTGRRDVRAVLDRQPAAPGPRPTLRALATHPLIVRALIAIFAVAPAIGFISAWGAKYLHTTFGIEQGDVGGYLWLPPLALDAGALLFGDLAARLPRAPGESPRVLYAIGATLAASVAVMPWCATAWQAIAVGGLGMAGGGALYTLVTADLLPRMPAEVVSFAGGTIAGAQSLSLIIANPLIGATVDRVHDYTAVCVGLGLWVIPGSVVWMLWRPAHGYTPPHR